MITDRLAAAAALALAVAVAAPTVASADTGDTFNPDAKLDTSQVEEGRAHVAYGTCTATFQGRELRGVTGDATARQAAREDTAPGEESLVQVRMGTSEAGVTNYVGSWRERVYVRPVRGRHTFDGATPVHAVQDGPTDVMFYLPWWGDTQQSHALTQYWEVLSEDGATPVGEASCNVIPLRQG